MGRIICELERIYGVRQGSNNPKGTNIGDTPLVGDTMSLTQELNIDSESYRRYKKLTTLIPELQEMVDTGSLTTSVTSRIIARLSHIDFTD